MTRHEYSEWLWIETGVSGADQQSSFMNGTLQNAGDLAFTVQTHVGVPASVTTETDLHIHLADIFRKITALGLEVAFEIQLGPEEDEDDLAR